MVSHKMKVEGDEGVGISLTGNVSMDDFEFLKVLGKGAYGKVFQARKIHGQHQGQLYALKSVNKSRIASSQIVCALEYLHSIDIVYRDLKNRKCNARRGRACQTHRFWAVQTKYERGCPYQHILWNSGIYGPRSCYEVPRLLQTRRLVVFWHFYL